MEQTSMHWPLVASTHRLIRCGRCCSARCFRCRCRRCRDSLTRKFIDGQMRDCCLCEFYSNRVI